MIEIEIKGPALNDLRVLSQKFDSLDRPVAESILYMERETKLNFARQSDPDGAPWAPLAASTLRRKKTGAILRKTGALAGSVQGRPSGLSGTVTVGIDYGIYHQTGTSKMPQRKIIGISEGRHVPKIRQIFEDHLNL